MRTVLQAILVASLLGSTISAVAQTGEFASPVTGRVMHNAWNLQDYLQNLRNGYPALPANPPPGSLNNYSDPNSAKPAVGTINWNGTKGAQ